MNLNQWSATYYVKSFQHGGRELAVLFFMFIRFRIGRMNTSLTSRYRDISSKRQGETRKVIRLFTNVAKNQMK